MQRRRFLVGVAAVLGAAACAAKPFTSDRIAVETVGTGRDVVLVPGHGAGSRIWRSTVEAMPGYRFHLVWMRGFGGLEAQANAQGPILAPVADEIARYIAESGLKNAAIVGHSMGGTLAMMVASRHPESVSDLVIVDMIPFLGGSFGPVANDPAALRKMIDGIREAMVSGDTEEKRRAEIEGASQGCMLNVRAERWQTDEALNSDRRVQGGSFAEMALADMRPELAKITAKTTVIYVTHTVAIHAPGATDETVEAMYRENYAPVRTLKLVRIPNSAHCIMQDSPVSFQEELRAALGPPTST